MVDPNNSQRIKQLAEEEPWIRIRRAQHDWRGHAPQSDLPLMQISFTLGLMLIGQYLLTESVNVGFLQIFCENADRKRGLVIYSKTLSCSSLC